MKKLLILIIAAAIAGCASTPLTNEEQAVRLLRKSDAPANCIELGKIHAPGIMSITEEGREGDLKREGFKLKADTVSIDRRDENNTLFGTAFRCNK
jgi:hypothetical protein